MPRPLSDSWQYFELLAPDNGRSRKARCTFCGHEQAAGITRLHQHLLYRCSRITSDIREELRQKHGDRERESPPKTNDLLSHHQLSSQHSDSVNYHFNSSTLQNTLSNNPSQQQNNNNNNTTHQSPTNNMNPHSTYYETTLSPTTVSTNFTTANPIAFTSNSNTLGQQQQQQHDRSQSMLDCQLARAFFAANIPFESIENPHMINFLKRLQPNYIVPKGRRLKQFILKEQHWDLIPWDNEPELTMLSRTQHSPPPMLQQQQQQQQRRMMLSADANNNSNNDPLNNRLLSSLHPPTDLEGSL